MKKDFRAYLLQHERTHYYRVKTVTPIGDFGATDEERVKASSFLSRIENGIQKYEPISIERVKKTILQRTPLDFVNINNKEVFILDLELGMPVSPTELQHLITVILDVEPNHVMVYGENDPREIDQQVNAAVKDMQDEVKAEGLTPASVLVDADKKEADEPEAVQYGDSYNARLLKYFNDARAHEEDSGVDYNADVKDAVSAHPKVEAGEETEVKTVRRTYRDDKGNLKTLTRKIDRFGPVEDND
jgi:hypothetical protein